MGIIAKGVAKVVAYKKESTWGTIAGTSGGKQLRRVTSNFNLTKESYESNEIRPDYQVVDMRHGVRTATGALNGELSPGSYSDFFAAVLAKDYAAVTSITSLSVTIAASAPNYTVTRSTGSYITDGVKVGQVVRLAAAGMSVNNSAKNLLVVSVSALVLTVAVLSGTTMTPEGPIASTTLSFPGKYTSAPLTAHTDDSFTVEEWYSDIAQSEVYTGNKVGSVSVQLPASGLVTTDISFLGKNLEQTGTSQYFSTPTAVGTTGIFAAVNGAVMVNGAAVAVITSADFSIERGLESASVVGTNTVADIFTGRIRVTGNFSTYFINGTSRDYFNAETEISLVFAVTTSESETSDFVSFTLPRVKVGSADKDDGEGGISQSHSFVALLNSVTAAGLPATTLAIQDSAAS